jgi:hypothetical protein
MDEGGSFVPKSCASAVHYYRRAADVVGDHIVQHGVHIPKGKKDGTGACRYFDGVLYI